MIPTILRTIATLLMLLTLLCGAVVGQMVTIRVNSRVCDSGRCTSMNGYGTGVVVATEAGTSLILTAAHTFESRDRYGHPTKGVIDRVTVGGRYRGEVLRRWYDGTMDLAVVRAYATFPAIPLSNAPPRAGDTVTINGYDFAVTEKPELRATTCTVLDARPGQQASTSRSWPIGTSGGAVIDVHGNLAGIAVTSNGFIANRNFRQVVDSLAQQAVFVEPSRDAGQPAAAESTPSVQGDQQEATQPAAGDIKRFDRADPACPETVPQASGLAPAATAGNPPAPESGSIPRGRDTSPDPTAADASRTGESTAQPEQPDSGSKAKEIVGGLAGLATDVVASTAEGSPAAASKPWDPLIYGATGGTGVAVLWGLRAASAFYRRRKQRKTSPPSQPSPPQEVIGDSPDGFPRIAQLPRLHDRDAEEAKQLLRLGQLEARNPLLDSFMGMSFNDLLERDLDNPDMPPELRAYARGLRDEVRQRVDQAAPLATGKPYSDDWRKGTT